jgi:hypothetical protein
MPAHTRRNVKDTVMFGSVASLMGGIGSVVVADSNAFATVGVALAAAGVMGMLIGPMFLAVAERWVA